MFDTTYSKFFIYLKSVVQLPIFETNSNITIK